ncbi:MAG: hypothetical protein GY703_23745 [Gammaproteobacteria bacterium]|nr:hypothetical protein [Gammaproteobacteria bacterium]
MSQPVQNRRVAEAVALRGFFQEQWQQLQQLLIDWQQLRENRALESDRLSDAVESIVDGTDSRIRGIGSYKKQLRNSTRALIEHIEGVVQAIPPAMIVDHSAIVRNPLVRSLFRDRHYMQALFGKNTDIRAYFDSAEFADRKEVFALLFVLRSEKKVLGAEIHGDILLKEVQQTSVTFHGHQILGPGHEEGVVRSVVKRMLFNSVISHTRRKINRLRNSLTDEEKTIAALDASRNVNNPVVYLNLLVDELSAPKQLISVKDNLLRVNRMGIRLPMESGVSSDVLKLFEIEVSGSQSRVAALVRYPRNELSR